MEMGFNDLQNPFKNWRIELDGWKEKGLTVSTRVLLKRVLFLCPKTLFWVFSLIPACLLVIAFLFVREKLLRANFPVCRWSGESPLFLGATF